MLFVFSPDDEILSFTSGVNFSEVVCPPRELIELGTNSDRKVVRRLFVSIGFWVARNYNFLCLSKEN